MTKEKKKHGRKKKVLVPKWKLFRAKEPMISVFMWGINHSIRELACVQKPVMLLPNDFKAFTKIKVRNHLFNEINMPGLFKVKEYCPNVFQNIRDHFGVQPSEYLESLTFKELESETKELFITSDKKFVVKTIDSEGIAEIHTILPKYHQYIVESHGKTLLPQFLGLYRISVDVNETYMLVMRNVFGGRYKINRKYDLKGSTVQRQASEKERTKDLPTFKDNDFLLDDKYKVIISQESKEKLMKMLKSDTEFLSSLHLMDYSLLIGIHDIDLSSQQEQTEKKDETNPHGQILSDLDSSGDLEEGYLAPESPGPIPPSSIFFDSLSTLSLEDEFYGIQSKGGKLIYFIGLVDILTYYGVKKRTASAAKSVKYGSEAENISTVKPDQYARRLLEFVNKNVQTSASTSGTVPVSCASPSAVT